MIESLRFAAIVSALVLGVGGASARASERSSASESPARASILAARMMSPESTFTPRNSVLRQSIESPLVASLALLTLVAAAIAVQAGRRRYLRGLSVIDWTPFSRVKNSRRKDKWVDRRASLSRMLSVLRVAAHRALVMLVVAALVAGGAPVWAANGDSVWNKSIGDGITTPLYWFDGANWLPLNTIPNGTIDDGFTADFSRNPLSVAQQTVTLDQDVTIGHMILGDLNGNGGYIFSGGLTNKKFIFSNDPFSMTSPRGLSILKRSGGNDDIQADVQFNGVLDVTVLTGGSNLTLSGRLIAAGADANGFNKYGGGTLRLTKDLTGTIVDQPNSIAQFGSNFGGSINVYAGTLEAGASNYLLSNGSSTEVWSSVFGLGGPSGTTISLYGAQLRACLQSAFCRASLRDMIPIMVM